MHSASWRGRLPGYIAAFVAGTLFAWIAAPLWRMGVIAWNQEHYGLLVEQCDTAMREHFQAKQSVQQINDPQAQSLLDAAEIWLIVCQDYDLTQKRLMQWGLREEELSQMRLKAIEARATDLKEVIETHEIQY